MELTDVKGQVDVDHVSFAYEGDLDVLHDVDLHIKAGETLAVVDVYKRQGEMVRRFGAAREERDDPSPLQDDMRYPRSARAGKSGWYREVFSPLTGVRGDFYFPFWRRMSHEVFQ